MVSAVGGGVTSVVKDVLGDSSGGLDSAPNWGSTADVSWLGEPRLKGGIDAAIAAKPLSSPGLVAEMGASGLIFVSFLFVLVSIMFMIILQREGIGKYF